MEAPQAHYHVPVSKDGGTTTTTVTGMPTITKDKPLSRKEKKKLKQEEKKRHQVHVDKPAVVNEFNEISAPANATMHQPSTNITDGEVPMMPRRVMTPIAKEEQEEDDENKWEEEEENKEHEEEGMGAHGPLPKVPDEKLQHPKEGEAEEKYQYPVVKVDLSGHKKDYHYGGGFRPMAIPNDLSYAPASHHRVDDTENPPHDKSRSYDMHNNNNNNTEVSNGAEVIKESPSKPPVPAVMMSTNDWEVHVLPHSDLIKVVSGKLWLVEGLISRGNSLHRNMVIYKTKQGTLWIHSAVACHHDVMAKIEQLGPIETVVVPNLDHVIDLHVFQLRYPQAKYVAPRNIINKLLFGGHRIDYAAEDYLEPTYGIKAITPDGTKGKELVYRLPLENMTSALVFGDLLTNVSNIGLFKRFFYGNSFECPRHIQWNTIKNRSKFKQWLLAMAEPTVTSPPDTTASTTTPSEPTLKVICVSHGKPISENAVDMLKDLVKRF